MNNKNNNMLTREDMNVVKLLMDGYNMITTDKRSTKKERKQRLEGYCQNIDWMIDRLSENLSDDRYTVNEKESMKNLLPEFKKVKNLCKTYN